MSCCCADRIGNGPALCIGPCFQRRDLNEWTDNTDANQSVGGDLVIPAGTLTPGCFMWSLIVLDDVDHLPSIQQDMFLQAFIDDPLGAGTPVMIRNCVFPHTSRRLFSHGFSMQFFGFTYDGVPNAAVIGAVTSDQVGTFMGMTFPSQSNNTGYDLTTSPFSSNAVVKALDPSVDHTISWIANCSANNSGILIAGRSHSISFSLRGA